MNANFNTGVANLPINAQQGLPHEPPQAITNTRKFNTPQLFGIRDTAPYFHDHRARTLDDVVVHYQSVFRFLREVRGFPLPLIPDEDVAPIVAYMKKAF